MSTTVVSIIVCTRNRADSLLKTLAAFDKLLVPSGVLVEVVVVDNGSEDATLRALKTWASSTENRKLLNEPMPGQCRAYNRALEDASGSILVFTDDDVLPRREWLEALTRPLMNGSADAVSGPVLMSGHLTRPWVTQFHSSWLACNDRVHPGSKIVLVGANMAVSRRVLEKVPRFDDEMGPGALGHASDTLFSVQLESAGCRIAWAPDAVVEHHFSEDRLTRSAFEKQAIKRGEFNAYIAHHWFHASWRLPRLKMMREWARLNWKRMIRLREWWTHPAAPAWELPLLEGYHTFRCYARERRLPRKYERHGLQKLEQAVTR